MQKPAQPKRAPVFLCLKVRGKLIPPHSDIAQDSWNGLACVPNKKPPGTVVAAVGFYVNPRIGNARGMSVNSPNSSLSHPGKPIREVLPPGIGQTFNRQHPSNPFPLPRPLDQSLHGIANGYGMGIGTDLLNAITSLN